MLCVPGCEHMHRSSVTVSNYTPVVYFFITCYQSRVAIVKGNLCHVLLFTKIAQLVDDSHICVEIYTTAFSCSSLCLSPLQNMITHKYVVVI